MIKLTAKQIEQIAKAYCVARTEQDGIPRNYLEQIEVAQIMFTWYIAFNSVLEPTPTPGEKLRGLKPHWSIP